MVGEESVVGVEKEKRYVSVERVGGRVIVAFVGKGVGGKVIVGRGVGRGGSVRKVVKRSN